MKNLCILFLLFCSSALYAQILNVGFNSPTFKSFLEEKTYVVLTDDDLLNSEIVNAIEKYWKINDYEFVDKEDAEKYMRKESGFMLMDFNVAVGYSAPIYGVLPCNKEKDNAFLTSLLCYAPFDSYNLEKTMVDAAYRMEFIIKSIHDALLWVKTSETKYSKVGLELPKHINLQASTIKNKTLLIPQEIVEGELKLSTTKSAPFLDKEALSMYPYKYEIKPIAEIYALVEEKNADYTLLVTTANMGKLTINIYDLQSKSLVAFTYHVGNHVTEKTFKDFLDEIHIPVSK